jgi:hypothetical protein
MKRIASGLTTVAFFVISSTLPAQVPQIINYQGRVVVGTANFNGSGQFRFALVKAAGTTTFWSNDGTSVNGSQPTNAVSLSVSNGLYSVLLGDTAITNMTAIPTSVFNNADVRLRVWFNDGTTGSQQLTPDQRIAAVGYAVLAANVPDGAITAAKIASTTVTSANIANGAIGTAQIGNGVVTSAKIDSTTVQRRVTGTAPSGSFLTGINQDGTVATGAGGGVWSLNGTNAYYNGGSVGVGTSSPDTRFTVAGAGAYNSPNAAAITLNNTTPTTGRRWEWHALDDGNLQLVDFTQGASRMLIDAIGKVSIGTTAFSLGPQSNLEVWTGPSDIGAFEVWELLTNGAGRLIFDVYGGSENGGTPGVNVGGQVSIGGTPITILTVAGQGAYNSPTAAAITLKNTTATTGRTWEWHALDNGKMQLADYNAAATRLVIDTSGQVGIATDTPTATLSVNGAANNTTGTWGTFSDRRLKKNIEPMTAGSLDRLLRLEGVTYEYTRPELRKDYAGLYRGWVAQQVEEVFPDWVSEAPDGMKMVTPVGFNALTVEALRELRAEKDAQIKARDAEIGKLNEKLERALQRKDAENADLKQRLEDLEKRMNDKDGSAR